jgi:hypothetical protein
MTASQDQNTTARAQLASLETAFAELQLTMAKVDTFRQQASGAMSTTLTALSPDDPHPALPARLFPLAGLCPS